MITLHIVKIDTMGLSKNIGTNNKLIIKLYVKQTLFLKKIFLNLKKNGFLLLKVRNYFEL